MEHSVVIQGLHIRYLQKGAGIPVVLLHGYSFNAETWVEMRLFDELAQGYSVHSFDMPYGAKSRSDKLNTQNRDDYADFLNVMLQAFSFDKPLLIGASISGEVTLRYALRHKHAQALVVAGPVGVKMLENELSSITVPMLAIWGENDTISSPSGAKIIEEEVKNSEVHIIAGAGHPCYLDKPEEFTETVKDFFRRSTA